MVGIEVCVNSRHRYVIVVAIISLSLLLLPLLLVEEEASSFLHNTRIPGSK